MASHRPDLRNSQRRQWKGHRRPGHWLEWLQNKGCQNVALCERRATGMWTTWRHISHSVCVLCHRRGVFSMVKWLHLCGFSPDWSHYPHRIPAPWLWDSIQGNNRMFLFLVNHTWRIFEISCPLPVTWRSNFCNKVHTFSSDLAKDKGAFWYVNLNCDWLMQGWEVPWNNNSF